MLGVVVRFVLLVLSSFWFSVVSSPPLDGAFSSFLSSSSLICVFCFLCFGVLPLIPCPWSLSLGLSQAGPLAFAGGLSLGWRPSGSCCWCIPWGLPCSSLPSWFSGEPQSPVRPLPRSFLLRSLQDFVGSPPAELLLCPFRALRLCFSRAAAFPSCPRSLSLHALLFAPFLRMPSVSSSVMSWLEHFLQLVALFLLLLARPTLLPLPFCLHILILPFVRGLASSWLFSAVLLCLPSLWPILDLLLPSFFLLPFRCSVLIVQCLCFRFPVSRKVL